MAESSRSWNQPEAMSVTSGDVKENLGFHMQLAKMCVEEVHGLPTQKFNTEQCGYLVSKLEVAVESASLFLEWSQVQPGGPSVSKQIARQVENFELLVASAKEIESYVQSCSKDTWMESALTLAVSEKYVSSMGFNLELCKIAFGHGQSTPRSLTIDEVCKINKDELEIVAKKASRDKDTLLKNVTCELSSAESKDRTLAIYLVHQILEVQRKSTPHDNNILLKFFNWVVSGKQLGRGSSATVYEVMWLGIPAAKKTFDGPENKDFLKEVEILSQLCHPNITSMYCCRTDKWSCSIIMELMDGDLRNFIVRRLMRNNGAPPFTILEGVDLMLQVGEGVNYLHDKRIVHRDLKSSNILVKTLKVPGLEVGHVQAKVVDFGLSKTKEKSTYLNLTCNTGTHRWMAPEVIKIIKGYEESSKASKEGYEESSKASEELLKHVYKVDIYSFALVCFEILSGELPFIFEGSIIKVKEMILKGERPKIPDYCPQMLKSLIEKCWSQIPLERPCISDICLQLKYIKYLLMTNSNKVYVDSYESTVTDIVQTKMDCGPKEVSESLDVEEMGTSSAGDLYWEKALEPKHNIFLSYSEAQKDFIDQLSLDLERKKYYPFFAKPLPKGRVFRELIFRAAHQCTVVVLILSEDFFTRSKWPMVEFELFLEVQKKNSKKLSILPVYLGVSPKECLENEGRRSHWLSVWKKWAQCDDGIDVDKWEEALRVLGPLRGIKYSKYVGEVMFREKIVSAIEYLVSLHIQGSTQICKEPELEREYQVFLSYSGAQVDFTEQLYVDLERQQYYPFFAKRSLVAGKEFSEVIYRAARQCQVVVLILSEEYFTRTKWPMVELELFAEVYRTKKLTILPIYFEISQEQCTKNEARLSYWLSVWRKWAQTDDGIDVDKWEEALRILGPLAGIEYVKSLGEVKFREKVVSAIKNLVPL